MSFQNTGNHPPHSMMLQPKSLIILYINVFYGFPQSAQTMSEVLS